MKREKAIHDIYEDILLKLDLMLKNQAEIIKQRGECKATTSGKHKFITYDIWKDLHPLLFLTAHKKVISFKRCLACGISDL
jgi:hypothetical protein